MVKRIKRGQSTKQKRDPKNGGNEIIIKAKDSNSDLKKQLREKEEQIKVGGSLLSLQFSVLEALQLQQLNNIYTTFFMVIDNRFSDSYKFPINAL